MEEQVRVSEAAGRGAPPGSRWTDCYLPQQEVMCRVQLVAPASTLISRNALAASARGGQLSDSSTIYLVSTLGQSKLSTVSEISVGTAIFLGEDMTLKSSGFSEPGYIGDQTKELKSSVIKIVNSSSSSVPANSSSNPASEDGSQFNKKRKMHEEYNSLLPNGTITETTTKSLTTSEWNSSPAQEGYGKSLIVSSIVEISNSGPNNIGYKGDHEVREEDVETHLINSAGPHSGVNNVLQSSTSSMPFNINYSIEDDWEYSSLDTDAVRDICISILRRKKLPTKESKQSQKSPPKDNGSTSSFQCMRCRSMADPLELLICDCCEEAFHLSCCKPRVKEIPEEKWCCQVCTRKKPKRQPKKWSYKHKLPKPTQRLRGLGAIHDMLVGTEPPKIAVRIGPHFQVDVPEWSGPIPSNEDQFVEPSELDPSETAIIAHTQQFEGKKGSVSNWVRCREVLDTGIVCGKWRRAPLHVDQSRDWDCSCSVVWDPFHADCAVPQELETDEVLQQLKYLKKEVRPQKKYIKKAKNGLNHSKKITSKKEKNHSNKEP